MPKCTKENALGGFIADAEMAGKDVLETFPGMKLKERMGYAGRSSSLHARGSREDYPDLYAELDKLKQEKGVDVKPSGVAFFKHADKLEGMAEHVKPIGEAVDAWKKEVIKGDLTRQEGRKLWQEKVRPVVEEQEKLYKQAAKDPISYKKQRIQNYFDDLKGGEWMFGGTDNPIATMARRGAGYITGYDMTIAMFDMFELVYKGSTVHDPIILTRSVANTLFKGGPKAFGRMAENREFYASLDFSEEAMTGKAQFGKNLNWLMEHLNPQYYSNNFLVNVSAEMGRVSGKGAADSVEKIAFIPKIENTPEYMRRGAAEMTWARYGTEAFKYYLDMHANLGRAMLDKDPKAFVGSMSQLAVWYGLTSALTGTRTWAPPIIGDFISAASKNDNAEDIFDQMDKLPAFNLIEKGTGLDLSKSLRISAPLYGLAYSNFTSQLSKLGTTGPKILKALKGEDPAEAWKTALDAAFIFATLRFGVNPVTNKSTNEWLDLAIDYHSGEIDAEGAFEEAQKNIFGKQAVGK